MTASEMHENTIIQYEKINSQAAPTLSDLEVSVFLSNAQLYFIQTRINPILNIKKEGLEETEVRMQGLSALISTSVINSFSQSVESLPNGNFAELPLNFMYSILETCTIDKIYCDTGNPAEVPIFVVSHNDYSRLISNPFKRPYFSGSEGLVWRLTYSRTSTGYDDQTIISLNPITGEYVLTGQTGKRHELITTSDFNVTEYFLRYLKFPRGIVSIYNNDTTTTTQINCELDDSTHQAIIDIAVSMMKRSANQPDSENIPGMKQIE
jgi:hypothetical protein